jgi:flavin-dependent dehydrogenase
MDKIYQIGIVGGGLAGLTMAIQAVDQGYSTLLIEKESYPFHKVCGEYISMESYDFLVRLGLPLDEWNLPVITQLQLSDVQGNAYQFELPLGGFGISRFKLDEELYQLALKKGVTVLTSTTVRDVSFESDRFNIYTDKQAFKADVVAGSFGKRSNLDVKWNRPFTRHKPDRLSHYIAIKYHISYPNPEEQISLHNFTDGYCGISRIENNTCCLCYLTTAENLRKSGNSIDQMQQDILSRNPHLAEIFEEAVFLYQQPLTISQVSFHAKASVENHMLMIGDSAGMITPLCGNGMSMAMHGAKLAFESVDLYLKNEISRTEMESRYSHQWKKEFSLRLKAGRIVQRLFGADFTTLFFLKVMGLFPAVARMVIRTTHGKPF